MDCSRNEQLFNAKEAGQQSAMSTKKFSMHDMTHLISHAALLLYYLMDIHKDSRIIFFRSTQMLRSSNSQV